MSRWHRGNPQVKAMDSVEQQGAIPDSAGSGGSLAPKALLLTSPPGRRQNSASRSGSEDLHTLNEIISPVTFNTPSPPYASHYDVYEVGGNSQLGGATFAWEQPISWNLAQLVPPLPPGSPFLHLCHAGVPDSVSLQYETVSTSALSPSSSVPLPAASYPPAASRPPLDREWVSDIRRRENERRQKNPCKLKRRAKRAGLTRRQSESEQQILGGNEGCIKLCHDEVRNVNIRVWVIYMCSRFKPRRYREYSFPMVVPRNRPCAALVKAGVMQRFARDERSPRMNGMQKITEPHTFLLNYGLHQIRNTYSSVFSLGDELCLDDFPGQAANPYEVYVIDYTQCQCGTCDLAWMLDGWHCPQTWHTETSGFSDDELLRGTSSLGDAPVLSSSSSDG